MIKYPVIMASIAVVCIIVMFSISIYSFIESSRRSHQIIIEQSFRLGCNESTQFRKLEYCANAASEYATKK